MGGYSSSMGAELCFLGMVTRPEGTARSCIRGAQGVLGRRSQP